MGSPERHGDASCQASMCSDELRTSHRGAMPRLATSTTLVRGSSVRMDMETGTAPPPYQKPPGRVVRNTLGAVSVPVAMCKDATGRARKPTTGRPCGAGEFMYAWEPSVPPVRWSLRGKETG
jgi:hypothetical protein